MSTNLLESDDFAPAVQVPSVSDTTYPTVVPAGMGQLTNRTRHIQNTLTAGVPLDALDFAGLTEQLHTQYIVPTTRLGSNNLWTVNVTRLAQSFKWLKNRLPGVKSGTTTIGIQPTLGVGASGFWTMNVDGAGVPFMVEASAGPTSTLYIPLVGLPQAGAISSVSVRVFGAASAHAGLPANLPKAALIKYLVTSPSGALAGTLVGSEVTDSSANLAAYETHHAITIPGLAEDLNPVTPPLFYMLRLSGEYGTNAINFGLGCYGVQVLISGAT
jgi:hypothetical protein